MNKDPSQNTEEEEECKSFSLENRKFKKATRPTFKYLMSRPGKEMGFTYGIPVSRRQREKQSVSCVSERPVLSGRIF